MATIPLDPTTLTETTVVLRSRRRDRAQMLNHAGPGLVLLVNGFAALLDPAASPPWLAALSFVAGGTLIVAIVRELKSGTTHGGIAWVDIFAGAVLFTEALDKFHAGKKALPLAYAFLALATLLLGIFHETISRWRYVRVNSEGITVRPSRWRTVSFRWQDLRSLAISGTEIRFIDVRETRPQIDLRRADNRDEAITMIKRFAAAMNVKVQEIPV